MTCTENHDETPPVIGEVLPATPPRINLSNAEQIRQEMARVYREARGRKLDTSDASRFIYMLSQITKAHELSVVERRLAEIERAIEQRKVK